MKFDTENTHDDCAAILYNDTMLAGQSVLIRKNQHEEHPNFATLHGVGGLIPNFVNSIDSIDVMRILDSEGSKEGRQRGIKCNPTFYTGKNGTGTGTSFDLGDQINLPSGQLNAFSSMKWSDDSNPHCAVIGYAGQNGWTHPAAKDPHIFKIKDGKSVDDFTVDGLTTLNKRIGVDKTIASVDVVLLGPDAQGNPS
jgi:hypothetical protein